MELHEIAPSRRFARKVHPHQAALSPELQRLAACRGGPQSCAWLAWAAGLAGAAALAAGLWAGLSRRPARSGPGTYRVLPPDAGWVTLGDGSVVEVRRGGRFRAAYSPAARQVLLESGEARFAVAKNPNRPFLVGLGPVAVRAVGTAFDIRREPGWVEILVTEGRITIEDERGAGRPPLVPVLAAGRRARLRLDSAGGISGVVLDAPSAAETERLLAWSRTGDR